MAQPRFHGCDEARITTRWGERAPVNSVVNAYVRVGGKWTAVIEICTACGATRPTNYGPLSKKPAERSRALQEVWDDQRKRSGYLTKEERETLDARQASA